MTELQKRIRAACKASRPRTKQRMQALAGVRWALKSELGFLCWDPAVLVGGWYWVEAIEAATIYDGRDNEELKRNYARAVTGEEFEIVLV